MDMASVLSNRSYEFTNLKEAINAYHQFLQQPYPYDVSSDGKSLCISHVSLHGHVVSLYHGGARIYICDQAAFNTLQAALTKMRVVADGAAWPCINVNSLGSSINWFTLQGERRDSPICSVVYPYIWFMIAEEMQALFDYTASVLKLMPVQTVATVNCIDRIKSTAGIQTTTQQDLPLNMIITQPGDFIMSLNEKPDCIEALTSSPSSDMVLTNAFCVAEKTRICCLSDTESSYIKSKVIMWLEHHVVISFKSPFVEKLLSHMGQCLSVKDKISCVEQLESKMTFKEEVLDIGSNVPLSQNITTWGSVVNLHGIEEVDSVVSTGNNVKSAIKEEQIQDEQHDLYTNSSETPHLSSTTHRTGGENFSRLLQCPRCPTSFKHGLQGRGMKLLMSHVYNDHKRMTTFCTLTIRKWYSDLIEDCE